MFKYVVIEKISEKYLLMNTLSRQLVALESYEYKSMLDGTINSTYLFLVQNYFLVPQDFDDEKLKNQILNIAKLFNNKEGLNNFVIFTTTNCNARCFYCFEHGSKRINMNKKTANDVADFIIKESKSKKINIQWFGGEPLCNMEAIDIISQKLQSTDITFKSKMISNGYLFNEEIVKKAKNTWNLKKVQITLDGLEETYNKIKSYIHKDDTSPFKKILNNIENLLNNGIQVIVRINLDKHNYKELRELIDILSKKFSKYKGMFRVYTWLLYDNRGAVKSIHDTGERQFLTKQLLEIEDYIYKKGVAPTAIPEPQLKVTSCIADNKNSVVISPDGSLGKCDHHLDDEKYGSIYSKKIDNVVYDSWFEQQQRIKLCDECPLSPQCYKVKKCPDDGAYICDVYKQKQDLERLKRQMRNAYELKINNS